MKTSRGGAELRQRSPEKASYLVFDATSDLIGQLLRDAAADLDIPPDLRAAATREYKRVGDWLSAHADGVNGWVVYPQGSFLLNTVVLPASHDEYDVDTVCLRQVDRRETTQAKLKGEVGEALHGYLTPIAISPMAPSRGRSAIVAGHFDMTLRCAFTWTHFRASPTRRRNRMACSSPTASFTNGSDPTRWPSPPGSSAPPIQSSSPSAHSLPRPPIRPLSGSPTGR